MQTSRNGLLFIACREAMVEVPYRDGAHFSIGFGSNSPDIKPTDHWTPQECFQHLRTDVALRERDVNRMLQRTIGQPQFDALVSLHYNRGNRDFPEMMAVVNRGDIGAAAGLFPTLDTNSAGVRLAGLRTRRLAEKAMFLKGDYGQLSQIPWWKGDPHTTPRYEYAVQPGDLAGAAA